MIQIAQKALLTAWPLLDQWLTQEHAFLVDVQRIKDAHRFWSEAGEEQKRDALLSGLLLARGRDWLGRHPQRFAAGEMAALKDFIGRSLEAERPAAAAAVVRQHEAPTRDAAPAAGAASPDSSAAPSSYERTTPEYWLHRVTAQRRLDAGDQPLVIVSYASEDQKWVEDLRAYLDPRIELLQDPMHQEYRLWNFADIERGTRPGDEFPEIVAEKMWRCRAALILLSRDYFKSQYCKIIELPFLMWRREHHGLMCLPVRLGALPVNKVRLPSYEAASRSVVIDDLIDDRQATPDFANSRYRDLNLKQLREDGKESEIEHRFDGISRHVTDYLKTRYLAIEL